MAKIIFGRNPFRFNPLVDDIEIHESLVRSDQSQVFFNICINVNNKREQYIRRNSYSGNYVNVMEYLAELVCVDLFENNRVTFLW